MSNAFYEESRRMFPRILAELVNTFLDYCTTVISQKYSNLEAVVPDEFQDLGFEMGTKKRPPTLSH
jgi:hypothetical protein